MRTFFAFLVPLAGLCAQQLPDAEALTKKMEAAANRFHSIQYVEQTTMEMTMPTGPMKMTTEASTAKMNPGKSRIETNVQGMKFVMTSDGETTVAYTSMNNQYVRIPGALGPSTIMRSMGLPIPDMSKAKSVSKTLRDEAVEVDGVKHDCWVVDTKIGEMDVPLPQAAQMQAKLKNATMTSWVDKKLDLQLQMDIALEMQVGNMPPMSIKLKTLKKDLKVDQPIADSVFAFTPPADAKEVKELAMFGALPKPELVGKDAAAFDVKGVDGKSYSLAALKGKPVLLDFWATWCTPCRKSMPLVEKIAAEYKEQGLVVIAVNAGEERPDVEAFVKKNPMPYPAVLSGESGILEAYKIAAYPTFVLIGQDGKVAAEEIGFGGEEALRGMLPKAALKPPAK